MTKAYLTYYEIEALARLVRMERANIEKSPGLNGQRSFYFAALTTLLPKLEAVVKAGTILVSAREVELEDIPTELEIA